MKQGSNVNLIVFRPISLKGTKSPEILFKRGFNENKHKTKPLLKKNYIHNCFIIDQWRLETGECTKRLMGRNQYRTFF